MTDGTHKIAGTLIGRTILNAQYIEGADHLGDHGCDGSLTLRLDDGREIEAHGVWRNDDGTDIGLRELK